MEDPPKQPVSARGMPSPRTVAPDPVGITPRSKGGKRSSESRSRGGTGGSIPTSDYSTTLGGSFSEKRRLPKKKDKERTTPFNLPLAELPGVPKPDNQDSKVLKISISTNAPGAAQVIEKFPEVDPYTPGFAQIPENCVVVIICLENLALCQISHDGVVTADIKSAMCKEAHFTVRHRDPGSAEIRLRHEMTEKYLLGRDPFSEMNNYLIRTRKKQYHCLYYSKSTKEVTMGVGQEKSMFRVYRLRDEYQRAPRPVLTTSASFTN